MDWKGCKNGRRQATTENAFVLGRQTKTNKETPHNNMKFDCDIPPNLEPGHPRQWKPKLLVQTGKRQT
eukprot:scaffold24969_cov34-Attheya_sp.AAC.2